MTEVEDFNNSDTEGESPKVTFVVCHGAQKQKFRVHSKLVKEISHTFLCKINLKTMFTGDKDPTLDIEINCVPPRIFKLILKHMYGDYTYIDSNPKVDEVAEIISTSNKYKMEKITEDYVLYLIDRYMDENTCQLINLIKIATMANEQQQDLLMIRFFHCLRHRYLSNTLTYQDITVLFNFSDRIKLPKLLDIVIEFLTEKYMNVRYCGMILSKIKYYKVSIRPEIKQLCYNIIKENAKLMLNDDDDLLLVDYTICKEILDLEELKVDNEIDVIQYADRWTWSFAKLIVNKNRNTQLTLPMFRDAINRDDDLRKGILGKLRLLMLNIKELVSNQYLMSLLSNSERTIIFRTMETGVITSQFPEYLSKLTKRNYCTKILNEESHFDSKYLHSVSDGKFLNVTHSQTLHKAILKSCTFSFILNGKPCELLGFRIFAPIENTFDKFNVTIKIYREEKELITNEFNVTMDENNKVYCCINFKEKFTIQQNINYNVTFIFDISKTIYFYNDPIKELKFDTCNNLLISGDFGPIRDFIMK